MNQPFLENFTNQYKLSKTLRFELKPVGKTAAYLENFKTEFLQHTIKQDEKRAEDYKVVKELIDHYHRKYIDKRLNKTEAEQYIQAEDLKTAYEDYKAFKNSSQKEPAEKKAIKGQWETIQKKLRKDLAKTFKSSSDLFKASFIKKTLPAWLEDQHDLDDDFDFTEEKSEALKSFEQFTTCFTGFNENRKNMYVSKDQVTAIVYRLFHENLLRFFDNCITFEDVKKNHPILLESLKDVSLDSLGAHSLEEIFSPDYFMSLLTQTQIENYKDLIGGTVTEENVKIQGLNEKANRYYQSLKEKGEEKEKVKKSRIRFFFLYKQILSKTKSHSFVVDAFEDDKALLEALAPSNKETDGSNKETDGFIKTTDGFIKTTDEKEPKLDKVAEQLKEAALEKTYVKTLDLPRISKELFGKWDVIPDTIETQKEKSFYSLVELHELLVAYKKTLDDGDEIKKQDDGDEIKKQDDDDDEPKKQNGLKKQKAAVLTGGNNFLVSYFTQKSEEFIAELEKLKEEFLAKREEIEENLKAGTPLKDQVDAVESIKALLDTHMKIVSLFRPLHLVKNGKAMNVGDQDKNFYSTFEEVYREYKEIVTKTYDKVRNHITKKPFSPSKIKVNFEDTTTTLLDGWDVNKVVTNSSLLLEKDGLFYIGIFHPKHKNIFNYALDINDDTETKIQKKEDLWDEIEATEGETHYQKMAYKFLPTPNKMLIKVFFSDSREDMFEPSEKIKAIRNHSSHTKGGTPRDGYDKKDFSIEDCHTMIDFFKASIKKHPEWCKFDFEFSDTSSYEDSSGFYQEVEKQGYRIRFDRIKESYVKECIADEKLFLFQIYNKDFSVHSKGRPNLHTLYWRALFEKANLKNVVLKLNGQAKVFYRQLSIKKPYTHKAKLPITNKTPNNKKEQSTFEYDIIKDRRYTRDKFFFHVPIALNFKSQGTSLAPLFNQQINKELATRLTNGDDVKIIGIDRGERHLLYYSVIDKEGNIIEQDSLNTIAGYKDNPIDYHEKLDTKEKERDYARKDWKTIENIKDLKEGYLSHVIHRLAKLIIKHNAVVCLEDLNFGFKRGRFKIEKQVYQKFERALIQKLNYLVFKDKKNGDAGHTLKAYQLTAPFESFAKLGKQSGILYYVTANYTSTTDPVTGFVNLLRPKFQNIKKAIEFLKSFEKISYNKEKKYFEFAFDYKKMKINSKSDKYQTKWTVCTHSKTRYQYSSNDQKDKEYDITQELKDLFTKEKIAFEDGECLINQITRTSHGQAFYKSLFFYLRITLKLRHTHTEKKEDFILSPVANADGNFFDSQEHQGEDSPYPQNADANGAYNIARKGLWNLEQIRKHNWEAEKPGKPNLMMKDAAWFRFAIEKPYKKK